jgi:hypothetical protein
LVNRVPGYIVAQFSPSFYTLLPAGALVGVAAAPLWNAKCAYLIQMANLYSKNGGGDVQSIMERFFGIFFCIFRSCAIWGNLISSTVLSREHSDPGRDSPKLLHIAAWQLLNQYGSKILL